MVNVIEMIMSAIVNPETPRGRAAFFLKYDDFWGIKVYSSKGRRDISVSRQLVAYENGLGPKVGKAFEIKTEHISYYCFYTETVEVINPLMNDASWGNRLLEELVFKANKFLKEEFGNDVREVYERLTELGMYVETHLGNYGLKNGKVVCIDFE